MAKERLKSPRARLFVALDMPDDVRDALTEWQRDALADPAMRAVGPNALHVTLCFLGYHPETDIERIADAALDAEARAVSLRFLPELAPVPRKRPRLFAVGAESGAAVETQAQMSARLEAGRFYRPEKRPFWPHVTVARVRPERGRRGVPRRVEAVPEPLPERLLVPFGAVRMTLYRSNLRPQGAEYVSLASLALPQP